MDHDLAILEARERVQHRSRLERRRRDVAERHAEAQRAAERAQETAAAAGADVRRLRGPRPLALWLRLRGGHADRLDQEEAQHAAAVAHWEEAQSRAERLRRRLDALEAEREGLGDPEAELRDAMEAKAEHMRTSGGEESERLDALSQELAAAEARLEECEEATDAAQAAKQRARRLATTLRSARGWGTADMLVGGVFMTAIKHSRISEARRQAGAMQDALDRLNEELEDLDREQALRIDYRGFLTFADYFFDGLLVDWIVRSRIVDALERTQELSQRLAAIGEETDRAVERAHAAVQEAAAAVDGLLMPA